LSRNSSFSTLTLPATAAGAGGRFGSIITYLRHRVTNAKIQWVKYTARGFRNRQNFAHAIYFHCGGLDLAPEATK